MLITAISAVLLIHSVRCEEQDADAFPPDYLDQVVVFIGSLDGRQRRHFNSISNNLALNEPDKMAKMRNFVDTLPAPQKESGRALLARVDALGSVLPGQPLLNYVSAFLRLMLSLDEERREQAMALLEAQQTGAEFEESFLKFLGGMQMAEQKKTALAVLEAKRNIRKSLLQRLRLANISEDGAAQKAANGLREILLDTGLTHRASCKKTRELQKLVPLGERDAAELKYVIAMLKLKC